MRARQTEWQTVCSAAISDRRCRRGLLVYDLICIDILFSPLRAHVSRDYGSQYSASLAENYVADSRERARLWCRVI